jgi:hypothetical protein
MAVGRFDIRLNGVNYRVDRTAETPYTKTVAAQSAVGQALQGASALLHYREDILEAHQTDWSGGSQWWKARFQQENANSYFLSDGFDAWTTPGEIKAVNRFVQTADDNLWTTAAQLVYAAGKWWTVGTANSAVGDTSKKRLLEFTTATGTFDVNGTRDSGCASDIVWSGIYEQAQSRVYWLNGAAASEAVAYFDPNNLGAATVTHVNSATLADVKPGSALINWQGRLLYFNGDKVFEINQVSINTVTTVGDDGFGTSLLSTITIAGAGSGRIDAYALRGAVAGDDGVYYIKTLPGHGRGVYQPIIYRFFTDGATDVNEEVTRLPVGTLALNLFWHLGSLIIAATPDVERALTNDGPVRVAFYHVTNRVPGALGLPLGQTPPDESVCHFLGADEASLYVGGTLRLWVYDGIRGGIHPISKEYGNLVSLGLSKVGSNPVRLYLQGHQQAGASRDAVTQRIEGDDASTSYTHEVESGYLDFNLPLELKQLLSFRVHTESVAAGGTYTLFYELDDSGSFTSAGTHTTGTFAQFDLSTSDLTFRRLRFKIRYATTTTTIRPALKAISVSASGQDFVRVWDMTLDGQSARNVENQPVRPSVAFDAIDALAGTNVSIELLDGMRSEAADDYTTHEVKVAVASTEKTSWAEARLRTRLFEVI